MGFFFFWENFYKCPEIQRKFSELRRVGLNDFVRFLGLQVWVFWVWWCMLGSNFLCLIICWKSVMLEVIATQTILSSILELSLRCSKELPNKRSDIKEVVAKVTKLNWHFSETEILLFSFVIASDYEAIVHDKGNITFYSG